MKKRVSAMSLIVAMGCAGRVGVVPLSPLPFAVDTVRTQHVSDGVTHHFVYSGAGPWAIHVLDVDLTACNSVVAVKGADRPAGRIKTSDMLSGLAKGAVVLGGVNADFFSLTDGTPTGLLITDGHQLTPPSTQPVLAFDSSGTSRIDRFTQSGGVLRPLFPRDAVGGRPVLLRDSITVADIDSSGGVAFASARHPRTAAGVARNGRRLILAVVDGRQKPYSDGMTLRELATLMLALGARDAINLDGGGSTTFVYADPEAAGALHIGNKPSDKQGERPVGDALAIVKRCR